MLLVIADTYSRGYGANYSLFYIGSSKEDCIKYMKQYNSEAKAFDDFIENKNIGFKKDDGIMPWELSDEDKKTFDELCSKFSYDEIDYEAWKFDENNFEYYIKDWDGKKPLNIGGYAE